ncbi:MAG: fatty acid desaturase, partial [Alphaproteobacteria bacterium]
MTVLAVSHKVGTAARTGVEWQTVALLAGCYGVWGGATYLYSALGWVVLPVAALAVALHLSLQHEAIHGHPTRSRRGNEALVFPALSLFIP